MFFLMIFISCKWPLKLLFVTFSTIATCASDGEAKVFTSLDDENPIVMRVDDAAYAVGIAVSVWIL